MEHLKDTNFPHHGIFSGPDYQLADHPQRAAVLWKRGQDRIKEVHELERVRPVCLEVRSGWKFDTLDLLLNKLNGKRKGYHEKGQIDRLCKARIWHTYFVFCIVSMIMFRLTRFGNRLTEKFIQIWRLVITISPFPALFWSCRGKGAAVPGEPILPDSGSRL